MALTIADRISRALATIRHQTGLTTLAARLRNRHMRGMNHLPRLSLVAALVMLSACQSEAGRSGDGKGVREGPGPGFAGIAEDERLRFTGTEPFWGGEASGSELVYTTPENPDGSRVSVSRFAGNNGLSLSGKLGGQVFDMAVTEAPCSDGMSDRSYPFTVSLRLGGEERSGCAWTERRPFSGPEAP